MSLVQVTLNIDASQFSDAGPSILGSLSEEDKKQIAKEVVLGILRETNPAERKQAEEEALASVRRSGSYYANRPDNEIKQCSDYMQIMNKFSSTRQQFLIAVSETTMKYMKEQVDEIIKTDPEIQKMVVSITEEIRKAFPAVVQNAMTLVLAKQLEGLSQQIQSSLWNSSAIANSVKNLEQHLGIPVSNIG